MSHDNFARDPHQMPAVLASLLRATWLIEDGPEKQA